MKAKTSTVFLLLVLVQAMHSTEEYLGRLWQSFPPARYLTGLISDDREEGFIIANIALFVIGLICWILIRRNHRASTAMIWAWIVIETINGIGHPVWTVMQAGYTPGVATAPILLFLALYLARLELRSP